MADSKKMHPGFKKNAKVIVVVIGISVASVAVAFLAIKGRRAPPPTVEVPSMDTRGATQTPESPSYAKTLERTNHQGFQKAEKADESFIPTFSERNAKVAALEDSLNKRESENPPQQRRDLARPNQTVSTTQDANAAQPSQNVSEQVTKLMATWTPESSQEVLGLAQAVSNKQDSKSSGMVNATYNSPSTAVVSAQQGGGSTAASPYIRGLDQIPAIYANSIDTDAPSDVLAKVETGKFAGSVFFGTARLSNEVVITEFTKMKIPTGEMLTITAVALDEEELRTAQPADIDHRYVQRIGIPAVLGAIGAVGAAYQNAGSIIQQTPLGGVTQTTNPNPSTRQIAGAAGAGGIQATQQVIQQETASIPPRRGRIKKGTPIMVLFKGDVYLK